MVEGKGIVYSSHHPRRPDQRAGDRLPHCGQRARGQDIPGLTDAQEANCRESAAALVGPAPPVPPEGTLLPETYNFSRGDTRANVLNLHDARARPGADRRLGPPRARSAAQQHRGTGGWPRSSRRRRRSPTSAAASRRSSSTGCASTCASSPIRRSSTACSAARVSRTATMITVADLDTPTPYNTYTIDGLPPGTDRQSRAAPRSRRSPIRRGPATSSSSPTARAGMPLPRPTRSISATSPAGAQIEPRGRRRPRPTMRRLPRDSDGGPAAAADAASPALSAAEEPIDAERGRASRLAFADPGVRAFELRPGRALGTGRLDNGA